MYVKTRIPEGGHVCSTVLDDPGLAEGGWMVVGGEVTVLVSSGGRSAPGMWALRLIHGMSELG